MARREKGGKNKGNANYIQEGGDKKIQSKEATQEKLLLAVSKFGKFFIEIQHFKKNAEGKEV